MTLLTNEEFTERVTRYCQLDDALTVKKDDLKCTRERR